MTGDVPRAIARPAWLTARARNAVNRPIFIAAVGGGAFIAVLIALLFAPQQVRRIAHAPSLPVEARPDTAPLIAALAHARTRFGAAEGSLSAARSHAAEEPAQVVDTISPRLIALRDTLSGAVNDLDALLTRVETAPLTASYRALAESPQLTSNPRVKALLDSLADIERDRDSFGTTGAADPVYVALTARAMEIGRAIQAIAQTKRDALRLEISKLNAPAVRQAEVQAPSADTTAWIAERDSAQSMLLQANTALADARMKATEYDVEVAHATEAAKFNAPPVALLGAALVFGIALGFGVAFFGEMQHPRVRDEHETERLTGARVLATIIPRPPRPDRQRRAADKQAPPHFDPGADGYQLTYLHVARAGASRLMLTIASEHTEIAAVIATNVAAIAADEARSTILIDTDERNSPVAAALRIHAEPGVADVIDSKLDWAEVTTQVMVGRDRVIDVLPSGTSSGVRNPRQILDLFRQEGPRLARHYEAIILVAAMEQTKAGLPGVLPIPDTILCARIGHTKIADLRNALSAVRESGGHPVGVVLWDAPPPSLPSPERIARAPRTLRTDEMKALSRTS